MRTGKNGVRRIAALVCAAALAASLLPAQVLAVDEVPNTTVETPTPTGQEEQAGTIPEGSGLVLRQLGEIHPAEWGHLAQQTRPLSADQAAALTGHWQVLKRENAPLRAVLNGVLVSAPETLYDPYLQRVLDEQEETFPEAVLIGRTLGRFPLGFGDAWLDLRVEQWITDGKLTVVTPAAPDMPRYHRQLRKRRG